MGLPQRKTVYYESYSRLRDATGGVIMPAEYLAVAEPAGLMTAIDNLLLFRCVQIVRRLAQRDRKVGIFCNISMASLGDEEFFPQFHDLLRANRDLAPALIFEIGQAAFEARTGVQARNMARLADLGFRFSIDKVTNLDLDLQDLTRADVKFVKVAAQALLDELTEVDDRLVLRSLPDLAAEDFALLMRRYGVELIAEKGENERQVVTSSTRHRLAQGHLFGEPAPSRTPSSPKPRPALHRRPDARTPRRRRLTLSRQRRPSSEPRRQAQKHTGRVASTARLHSLLCVSVPVRGFHQDIAALRPWRLTRRATTRNRRRA